MASRLELGLLRRSVPGDIHRGQNDKEPPTPIINSTRWQFIRIRTNKVRYHYRRCRTRVPKQSLNSLTISKARTHTQCGGKGMYYTNLDIAAHGQDPRSYLSPCVEPNLKKSTEDDFSKILHL